MQVLTISADVKRLSQACVAFDNKSIAAAVLGAIQAGVGCRNELLCVAAFLRNDRSGADADRDDSMFAHLM